MEDMQSSKSQEIAGTKALKKNTTKKAEGPEGRTGNLESIGLEREGLEV